MRAAEFFAGIGLVRLALEKAGWEVVFANDIDPRKHSMYRDGFGEAEFRLSDIRELQPETIPEISLATASFPCIDVSLAGNRAGLNGKHSSAYWYFFNIIEGMGDRRPPFIILENVLGLISSHGGQDLRAIIQSLNALGYFCDILVADASWFLPQSRPRLFVLGIPFRSGQLLPVISQHPARPRAIAEFIFKNPELKWSFAPLPEIRKTKKRLRHIVERVPARSSLWWDTARQEHLFGQMSDKHKKTLREMLKTGKPNYATVYKRVRPAGCRAEVRWDGFAGCLRTPRGGSSKQFVIHVSNGKWKVRNMTAREYARLQGVPDSYPIRVPENTALLGFGDAVCVPAVEWVIRGCINPLVEEFQRERKYIAQGA